MSRVLLQPARMTRLRALAGPGGAPLRQAHSLAATLPAHLPARAAQACALPRRQAPASTSGSSSGSSTRQLHSGRWRCRAAAAAAPGGGSSDGEELSLNALKRREAELKARVADAVQVSTGAVLLRAAWDGLEEGPRFAPPACGLPCTHSALTTLASPFLPRFNRTQVANLPGLQRRLAELEAASGAADLWDAPGRAQALLQQLTRLRGEAGLLERFLGQLEDLAVALELLEMEVRLLRLLPA